MRETRADTAQAFVYAVALHALLFALMFIGLWWTRNSTPQESWGSPVEAEVVDASKLSSSLQRALKQEATKPPPPPPEAKPLPEPIAETPPPPQPLAQERLPEPEPEQQEEVRPDAVSPEVRPQEQEAKQRQAQVDLDEQKQREIQEQLRKVQADLAKARRESDLHAQRLQQIADWKAQQASDAATAAAESDQASSAPPRGNPNADNALAGRYAAALTDAILRNWTRPENIPDGLKCRINIIQLQGGKVIDVQVSPACPYDALGKRSVETAVLKAQPLPYAGFETVFRRSLELDFTPH